MEAELTKEERQAAIDSVHGHHVPPLVRAGRLDEAVATAQLRKALTWAVDAFPSKPKDKAFLRKWLQTHGFQPWPQEASAQKQQPGPEGDAT